VDLAVGGLHFLDADLIVVGLELHVVENADRRHDEAQFEGKLATQGLDLLGEAVGAGFVFLDEAEEAIAEFELEIVDLEAVADRGVAGRGGAGHARSALGRLGGSVGHGLGAFHHFTGGLALRGAEGGIANATRKGEEG